MPDYRLLEVDYDTPPIDGQVPTYDAALGIWASASVASGISGLTTGGILFGGATGGLEQDASNLFYADSTNRLSIGTSSNYTAKVNILAGSATERALVMRLAGSQTANALEIQNSAGTILSGFREEGSLLLQTSTTTSILGTNYYAFSAKGDGTAKNYAFIIDRARSQTNSGQGVGFFLKDNTSYVGMRMWSNSFTQNLYDWEFFPQVGKVMAMPSSGGIFIYNPLVNTQDVSCMKVPAQTIYPGAGAADPAGFFVFEPIVLAATSPNTLADSAQLLLKGAPTAGVNMTLTRRYNMLAIANTAGDVLGAFRAHASQTGNLIECQSSTPTNLLAYINKDGGAVFNEQGIDTDFRVEGDTDANLLFVDASTDRVGFGTNAPVTKVEVFGLLSVKQGTASTAIAKVGGAIADYITDGANSGTTETDLFTTTLPANCLSTNGDKLLVWYGINMPTGSGLGTTRTLKLYFGGNIYLNTGALTLTGNAQSIIEVEIIRISSSAFRYNYKVMSTNTTSFSGTAELTGLTFTGTNIIKVTGQAGVGGASNDIVGKCGGLGWFPAA